MSGGSRHELNFGRSLLPMKNSIFGVLTPKMEPTTTDELNQIYGITLELQKF